MVGAPSSLGTTYVRYLVRGKQPTPAMCAVEIFKQNRVEAGQGPVDTRTGQRQNLGTDTTNLTRDMELEWELLQRVDPEGAKACASRGREDHQVAGPGPPRRSVAQGQLHGEPVVGHLHRPLELLARLREQPRGIGVVAAGQVREDEAPGARLARHLRRLARRRVPRLLRPRLLVVGEGGLVDEQVRVLRRRAPARRTGGCRRR